MNIKKISAFAILFISANSWSMSNETLANLCNYAVSLDTTLALQSLQTQGQDAPTYRYFLNMFRLTDEQVAPVIERYKKRPGDARLIVQYPPHADRYYLENCMADPVRYIPNYENLKSVYK